MKKETKLYPYEKRLTRKGERNTGVDAHKKMHQKSHDFWYTQKCYEKTNV